MHIKIFYSTITGNTEKVASRLKDSLLAEGHLVDFENTRTALSRLRSGETTELSGADLILICFWCRRASMDDLSLQLLSLFRDQPVAAAGTMGGNLKGAYGQRVRNNVTAALQAQNICRGVFLCQGKIAEERTEAKRRLPKDHPHYLDDAGYARHLATRTHPDQQDLSDAEAFVRGLIS